MQLGLKDLDGLTSKGEHPGQASVNPNPPDLRCINSTLDFVVEHSFKYCLEQVITFDQLSRYKATTIIENESKYSPLRYIVPRLDGFYTLMIFLGLLGTLWKVLG